LQAVIIDYSGGFTNGRIIDYIQLDRLNNSRDLNAEIQANDVDGMWDTNYDTAENLLGVFQQIYVSKYGTKIDGSTPITGVWSAAQIPGGPAGDNSPMAQQAFFRGFFAPNGAYSYNGQTYYNTATSIQTPYTPITFAVQYQTWQANDPLIHYLTSDLNGNQILKLTANWPENLGVVNNLYQPWGRKGTSLVFPPVIDANLNNLAYKDPLVWSSDNWNFPTNKTLDSSWLGQVHRGTPWQTIFLKSTNVLALANGVVSGTTTWIYWTGDSNLSDATNMAPVKDWHMASVLASMFNTNDLSSLFSVNNPASGAWSALLDGMTVLTNDFSDAKVRVNLVHFTPIIVSSNSPQASIIANAIESARMSQPNHLFSDVADIFAITPMIEQSPFLNINSVAQRTNGISDEAFEEIPSQLLPLLRTDSIGTMNGQSVVQFSGYDGHLYLIQVSSDLINWSTVSTNSPADGVFSFTNTPDSNSKFYRSVLLN